PQPHHTPFLPYTPLYLSYCTCHAILYKLSNLVILQAEYAALVLEHDVVTEHAIALATTARPEALACALIRWEVVGCSEITALEGDRKSTSLNFSHQIISY